MARECQELLEGGYTAFEVTEQQANRLIVCGPCPESDIEGSKASLRAAMMDLINKIEIYEEHGFDPDLSRIKRSKRSKAYRERHKDEILVRRREERMIQRHKQLGGTEDGT